MQASEIDPTSDKGEEIEGFTGGVDFKHVTFAYPSRPNVPVRIKASICWPSYTKFLNFSCYAWFELNNIAS